MVLNYYGASPAKAWLTQRHLWVSQLEVLGLNASLDGIICPLEMKQAMREVSLIWRNVPLFSWPSHCDSTSPLLIPRANELPRRTCCSPSKLLHFFSSLFSAGALKGKVTPQGGKQRSAGKTTLASPSRYWATLRRQTPTTHCHSSSCMEDFWREDTKIHRLPTTCQTFSKYQIDQYYSYYKNSLWMRKMRHQEGTISCPRTPGR